MLCVCTEVAENCGDGLPPVSQGCREIGMCDHSYGNWSVTTTATCDAQGAEKRTCSKCGNVETRTIARLTGAQCGGGNNNGLVLEDGFAWVIDDQMAIVFKATNVYDMYGRPSYLNDDYCGDGWFKYETGNWSSTANQITLITLGLIFSYTLSADGNSLTLTHPQQYGADVFTKEQCCVVGNTGGSGGDIVTIDEQNYRTVQIGNLTWMAENLNRNTGNSLCYDNSNLNCAIYGRLYTWNDAMTVCPSGWRLPTDSDWDNLMLTVGGVYNHNANWDRGYWSAGTKLKSKTGWCDFNGNNGNGTDNFGFSALPGGGDFYTYGGSSGGKSAGRGGVWWSATGGDTDMARSWSMYTGDDYVSSEWTSKSLANYVRCVRN